ncbi:hypothetical protein CDAR_256211 [Caerostris darwini]|uniref:Maturase K n=1 Tax=Caerostris darwini TaxID=1538125 RepID=A0AAV4TUH7_9ARAC|nr:hypothetical protein CDAR_256211 [Caerostris darwini]
MNGYQWEFVTGKILQLYSFRSLPDISLDGIFLNPFSKKDNKIQTLLSSIRFKQNCDFIWSSPCIHIRWAFV